LVARATAKKSEREEVTVTVQGVGRDESRSGSPTAGLGHAPEVGAAHERVLAGSPARSRYVEVTRGQRVHLIEADEGTPLVLIHGSGPSALLFLPLLARLKVCERSPWTVPGSA
jgi:hypothetical protein